VLFVCKNVHKASIPALRIKHILYTLHALFVSTLKKIHPTMKKLTLWWWHNFRIILFPLFYHIYLWHPKVCIACPYTTRLLPYVSVQWLPVVLCNWEILGLILSSESSYSNWGFCGCPQSLLYPSQLIIYHRLPTHCYITYTVGKATLNKPGRQLSNMLAHAHNFLHVHY
jgi:hypothetical protein